MKKPITLQNAVGKPLTNYAFSMFDQMLLVFGDEYVCLEHKRDDIEEDDLNLFDFGDDLLINAGILSADELSIKREERDAASKNQYENEQRAIYERLKARFEENADGDGTGEKGKPMTNKCPTCGATATIDDDSACAQCGCDRDANERLALTACSASSESMSLPEFQREMHSLNQWAQHGCGDGGCQIEKPKGMHTNGGCRCNPKAFSDHLLWLACELEKLGRYKRWKNDQGQTTPTAPKP